MRNLAKCVLLYETVIPAEVVATGAMEDPSKIIEAVYDRLKKIRYNGEDKDELLREARNNMIYDPYVFYTSPNKDGSCGVKIVTRMPRDLGQSVLVAFAAARKRIVRIYYDDFDHCYDYLLECCKIVDEYGDTTIKCDDVMWDTELIVHDYYENHT